VKHLFTTLQMVPVSQLPISGHVWVQQIYFLTDKLLVVCTWTCRIETSWICCFI